MSSFEEKYSRWRLVDVLRTIRETKKPKRKRPSSDDRFKLAMGFLLTHEGGTNNDPIDRGGLTKYGISQKSYPTLNIRKLTVADATVIYYNDYWKFNACSQFHPGLDIVLFDSSVNCGSASAVKWLQTTLNDLGCSLDVNGRVGTATIVAADKFDSSLLVQGVMALRLKRYSWIIKKHPKQSKYIRGWIERSADLLFFVMMNHPSTS